MSALALFLLILSAVAAWSSLSLAFALVFHRVTRERKRQEQEARRVLNNALSRARAGQ